MGGLGRRAALSVRAIFDGLSPPGWDDSFIFSSNWALVLKEKLFTAKAFCLAY